ncbi:hypothetical protein DV737_g1896, partial [Chaetothyriales sp. CBS 132003]
MASEVNNINITAASLRGSPSDRIIRPRPRKDSLQSISGSDSVPGRIVKPRARKSPGSGAKRSEPAKRKFQCSFFHYGCDVTLSSKNEWKRHVSIQHLQLGFYRCDVGSCNPDLNPGVPGHKRVYNDFNRKDLFTQHHRRMHKPETGPGSGVLPSGQESSADWKAFEDSLESVRQRCWVERRKPPQRSTCGFCGRVFEGEGSWNERMEHVGGHFSRDVIEAKEEREDEDLTNWALQEAIIKDAGNGSYVLSDQPPGALPCTNAPISNNLIDPSISNSSGFGDSNGYAPASAVGGPPLSPTSERRNYNLAPPPLGGNGGKAESGDRLEDLIHQLTKPKEPKLQRRLTWKCDCNRSFSVDVDETESQAIKSLKEISIVCSQKQSPYLKSPRAGFKIVKCEELGEHVWREAKVGVDITGGTATAAAALLLRYRPKQHLCLPHPARNPSFRFVASMHTVPKLKDPSLLIGKAYINGEFVSGASGETFQVHDPSTGSLVGDVAELNKDDALKAVAAAEEALVSFRKTVPRERATLLRKWYNLMQENADDLATLITWENGKPLADAKGEVQYAAAFFNWFSEEAPRIYGDTIAASVAGNRVITLKQPVGVCGLITPWNFPAAMITRKVGPALAAGCTVVIKSPGETPFTANAIAELSRRAGIPKGVVNVITTLKNTIEIGQALTTDARVKKVSFTGSTNVGKILMKQASSTVKKLSFELGGNSPFIVFDDAPDLDTAVAGAVTSKFRSSGQTCVCANVIFVQDGIYDEFAKRLAETVKAFRVGHGFNAGVTHGPVIHDRAVSKVESHVKDAEAKGAKVTVGGQRLPDLGSNFFAPTVLTGVNHTMQITQEETFGPVAALVRFKTEKEVLAIANKSSVGLAGYFYSKDIGRVWRVAEALEVGMVGVNTGLISDPASPFGGVKESGFGREGSKYGVDEYLVIKTGLLAVPFVLTAQPEAAYGNDESRELAKAERSANQKYADIFRDVEYLILDQIQHQQTKKGISKLSMLVPSISSFFTPLALEDAFQHQDKKRAISSRRFVPPSFNDIRLILNTAQIMSIMTPKPYRGVQTPDGSILELMTFDGDVTLYDDGASLVSLEENPVIGRLLHFLASGVRIGIVTAAGYTNPSHYFSRLGGLLTEVRQSQTLTKEQKSNLIIMGGESNFLMVFDQGAEHCLRYVSRRDWILESMQTWTESAIQQLLDVGEAAFHSCITTLRLKARVLRKERAVGIYAADQSVKLTREQLEETVLVVTQQVERSLLPPLPSPGTKASHASIPFTVFNGGADVFLDIGDKSLGVQACQKWFGGIEPARTLHVGDQFLSGGGNDFKAPSLPAGAPTRLRSDADHAVSASGESRGSPRSREETPLRHSISSSSSFKPPGPRRTTKRDSGGFLLDTLGRSVHLSRALQPTSHADAKGKSKSEVPALVVPKRKLRTSLLRPPSSIGSSPLSREVVPDPRVAADENTASGSDLRPPRARKRKASEKRYVSAEQAKSRTVSVASTSGPKAQARHGSIAQYLTLTPDRAPSARHGSYTNSSSRLSTPPPAALAEETEPSPPSLLDDDGQPLQISLATAHRVQNAKTYFELAYEHRRLLSHLPPIARPGSRTSYQSKQYNPLQYIRNRKLRIWDKTAMDAEEDGWHDVDKVRAWVTSVVESHPETIHGPDECVRLPPLSKPASGTESDSDAKRLKHPAPQKARRRRPRSDWVTHPGDLIADCFWLEQGVNKVKILDRDNHQIYPQTTQFYFSGGRDYRPLEDAPVLPTFQSAHSQRHSHDGGKTRQRYKVKDPVAQYKKVRRRGLKMLMEDSASGSDSSRSPGASEDEADRGRKRMSKKWQKHMHSDESSAPGSLLLPTNTLSMSNENSRASSAQNSNRPSTDHGFLAKLKRDSARGPTPNRSRNRNDDGSQQDPIAKTSASHDLARSSAEYDSTAPNSPMAAAAKPPIWPSIVINLDSPPPSRPPSPVKKLKSLNPFQDRSNPTKRDGVSRSDFAIESSSNERDRQDREKGSGDSAGTSPMTRGANPLTHPRTKSSTNGIGVTPASHPPNPLGPSNPKSASPSAGVDHPKIRGIFKGGRIAELVGTEVSRVGNFIWKPYYHLNLPSFTSPFQRDKEKQDLKQAHLTPTTSPANNPDHISRQAAEHRSASRSPRLNQLAPPKLDTSRGTSPARPNGLSHTFSYGFGEPLDLTNSRVASDKLNTMIHKSADNLNAMVPVQPLLELSRAPSRDVSAKEEPRSITAADIDRARALILSSAIKAKEISRRADVSRNPGPLLRLNAASHGRGSHQVDLSLISRRQQHVVAARNLTLALAEQGAKLDSKLKQFSTRTAPRLHRTLQGLEDLVDNKLTPRVRASADEAGELSTKLNMSSTLAVKNLNDTINRAFRRRRRGPLRSIRRLFFATIEYTVVALLWAIWAIVTVLSIFLRIVKGSIKLGRWILFLD